MPNLNNYPYWFSMHYKPDKPSKPAKKVPFPETLKSLTSWSGSSFKISEIPEGADMIELIVNSNYGTEEVIVNFLKNKMVDNPVYGKQIEDYKVNLKQYKKRIKDLKLKYEQELANEIKAAELATLKKLKEKYGE